MSYDSSTGFFGTEVRGDEHAMTVSEYDLILAVSQNGSFRIMTAQPKVLLGKLMMLVPFEAQKGQELIIVYRDSKRMAYAKRIKIEKFIRNREYRLFSDKAGKIDFVGAPTKKGTIKYSFVPSARAKLTEQGIAFSSLELVPSANKGTRLAPKPVSRIRVDTK